MFYEEIQIVKEFNISQTLAGNIVQSMQIAYPHLLYHKKGNQQKSPWAYLLHSQNIYTVFIGV